MTKIKLMDVKQALSDERFRDALPESIQSEIKKYVSNPGCPCNIPLYRKILTDYKQQLKDYFPGRDLSDPEEETQKLAENNWTVINCNIVELEDRLRKLPPGRKQLAITRYQDLVTVIVNELDVIY